MWHTGGTPERFDNGTLTNFHKSVRSLWRGGLSNNLLEDYNDDNKGWANKVYKYFVSRILIRIQKIIILLI